LKLNYRYTLAYAFITFLVLSLGFGIVYAALTRSFTQATLSQLEQLNGLVAGQLRAGRPYAPPAPRAAVEVGPAPVADSLAPVRAVQQQPEWDEALQAEVTVVRLTTYVAAGGRRYRIVSHAAVIEPGRVHLGGLLLVFAWTFVFLLALVVVLSELLSWRILRPFTATLQGIRQFQLGQAAPIEVAPTHTAEFRVLNEFLVKMTAQAQRDYQGLREFSENASHELQTPLASIKAKLELLMDTELTEHQLRMLTAMHDELERLAKINQALTLLAKLEHYEVPPNATADLSTLVQATAGAFADLAELKSLRTSQQLTPGVRVAFDESLAQVLLNNLFSNAIRHNVPGGELRLTLTSDALTLANTGQPPLAAPDELFGRFKKGNAALDSIGIGLAVVKRISELYGHRISYTYAAGWHQLTVTFGTSLPVAEAP
jgi:signal transduction histidine kinase